MSDFKAHAAGTAYEAAASFTVGIVDEALNEGDEMIVLRAETGFGEVSAEHALTITDGRRPAPTQSRRRPVRRQHDRGVRSRGQRSYG